MTCTHSNRQRKQTTWNYFEHHFVCTVAGEFQFISNSSLDRIDTIVLTITHFIFKQTMSEQLRFIVTEINKLSDKEYNLISFDALEPDQLLQVLVDVLAALESLQWVTVITYL